MVETKAFEFSDNEETNLIFIELVDHKGKELAHRSITKDQALSMAGSNETLIMLDAQNLSEICGKISLKCIKKP